MKTAIAVAVCCATFAALAYGQSVKTGPNNRFSIVVAADGGTAWRIDTMTGGVIYCVTSQSFTSPGSPPVKTRDASCTEAVR